MRGIRIVTLVTAVLFGCDGWVLDHSISNKRRFLAEKKTHHHVETLLEGTETTSTSKSHNEGIVKTWLTKARLDKNLASSILETGGFVCWSVLVQLHLQHLGTNFVRKEERDKLLDMCYQQHPEGHHHHHGHHHSKHHHRSSNTTHGAIANRHHNGLGNQLFEYIFSRLTAESLGRDWTSRDIVPSRGETPYNNKGNPPNTEVGWAVFQRVFSSADFHYTASSMNRNQTETRVNEVCRADFRDDTVCRISDRPYDVRLYHKKMLEQMTIAYFKESCVKGCVYTIGYFQETIYFVPEREKILGWFGLSHNHSTMHDGGGGNMSVSNGGRGKVTMPKGMELPNGFPQLNDNDMSVHVRCCEPAGMCKWLFMPWGYYEVVLDHNKEHHPEGKVWIITTPQCATKALVKGLLNKYDQAQLVHPPDLKKVEDNVANDFRFLLNSPRLLLGKSTFGYWAGFFSPVATEIHMPVDPKALTKSYTVGEKIPFAYDDERYVHHAWEQGSWFGKVEASGKLQYGFTGKSVDLKQTAP